MSYISIISKLDEKINSLIDLACQLDHEYNYNIGSGGVCQWYEISCLEKKKEKVLSKLGEIQINKVSEIYDEAGYMLFEECEIIICGKTHKDVFSNNDILPTGEQVGFLTKKTELNKVAKYFV